jgi:hypothetical protein
VDAQVTAGHSHPDQVTTSLAKLNVPPVQTRFVKVVVDQKSCPALTQAALINEVQVIECPLCLSVPSLPDPDAKTTAAVNDYGHTLVGFWALDDHTLRDFYGGNDGVIHGNVLLTDDPARGPVLEFFGTPDSYVDGPGRLGAFWAALALSIVNLFYMVMHGRAGHLGTLSGSARLTGV